MNYHKVVGTILDLLKANNYWFESFKHDEVKTSEEASKVRTGYTIHQGAKALILKISPPKDLFVMLVIPGDMKFDSKKLKDVLKVKDIRFATEEEVLKITDGVQVGGVPPFGNLFNLPVYCDSKVLQNEKIVFNAGDRRFSVAMLAKDYKDIIKPIVVNLF